MNIWIIFGLMSLVAVGFLAWPLYQRQRTLSPLIGFSVIFIVALSTGLYYRQGSPDLPSAASAGSGDSNLPSMDAAIEGLAQRLAANPDDANGWMMLGRSYMSVGNFTDAAAAYEKAIELESAQNPQTLVGLGEALVAMGNGNMDSRAATLFENALALDPNFPQALFYGGLAAFNRDDIDLAADRWERLLALNPPPEIQDILRQRIAEWRGESTLPADHPPIESAQSDQKAAEEPADEVEKKSVPAPLGPMSEGAVIRASVTLTDEARAALPANATVYVIARDPAQPMPPIAATRRQLVELPVAVELSDRESMVPGRDLSGFAEIELIARVSLSGQPMAQPGDWFGAIIVKPADDNDVALSISEPVN
jgi:cytochrome c-type biogenesis protein CcmH